MIVIVIVEVEVPSATTGPDPVIVELLGDATALNVTVPLVSETGVTRESVFVSPCVDLRVQVETPEALLLEHAPYTLVLPVSVAEKVGTTPELALLFTSFRVIVTVDVAVPSALTGPEAVIVEVAADAPAELKTTVPPVRTTGVASESVLVSAWVDLSVQVEIPEVLELEQVPYAFVVPVLVAVNVGTVPGTGL